MGKSLAIELEIFNKLFSAIAEEMGIVLRRSGFSPNIRERCDFSCALFDEKGQLVAQASHIPVHLGAMPETMKHLVNRFDWKEGDIVITNDPFTGGTHLPDITLVKPVFFEGSLKFFLIARAHHADVGGRYAGSMAVSTHIDEEGVRITPSYLFKEGRLEEDFFQTLISKLRNPEEREGDFRAQIASLFRGEKRLKELVEKYSLEKVVEMGKELKRYSEKAMKELIKSLPKGEFFFEDYLDDDGCGQEAIPIRAKISIGVERVKVDFTESAPQVKGSVNAPRAVTEAAVYYVFLCLLNTLGDFPINHGCFAPIEIVTSPGTVVDAVYPAAVSGGNVETSQRIVDVLLGALSSACPELIPAASCGSMNNVAIGNQYFAYYETIGGGMGGRPGKPGLSGVHTHMTNTLNTPVEALEHDYPLRIVRYSLRRGSGGKGKFPGGEGILREYYFCTDATVTLLTERRKFSPYGLFGGSPGMKGENFLIDREGKKKPLPGKINLEVKKGERLVISTPGGGGHSLD